MKVPEAPAGRDGLAPDPDAGSAAGVSPEAFRRAVSRFATGITVITCRDGDDIRGMTCNSFISVSLQPATILVSLKAGRTHQALRARGAFGVSVLRDENQSYPGYFSDALRAGVAPEFVVRRQIPTLAECLAWFECRVVETLDVHDHTLFVAQVTGCGTTEGSPLMFYESRYHRYVTPPANRLPERT